LYFSDVVPGEVRSTFSAIVGSDFLGQGVTRLAIGLV